MCLWPGAAKQASRQACNQGENNGADGSRGRSAVKRVGGGYAHTPSQPTRAGPDAAARRSSSSEAPPQEEFPSQSPSPPATSEAAAAAVQGLAADLSEMRIGYVLHPQGVAEEADTAAIDAGPEGNANGGSQGGGPVSSPAKQQEEAAERPRGTPHSYVPSALKTAVLRREELVLGSPSTRASTPQSRTQVGDE